MASHITAEEVAGATRRRIGRTPYWRSGVGVVIGSDHHHYTKWTPHDTGPVRTVELPPDAAHWPLRGAVLAAMVELGFD